jgi:putative oxidoreductase
MALQPQTVWQDLGKLILRLGVAFLLLLHGIGKLQNGVGWMDGMLTAAHLPTFLAYGVYVGEIVAPILLILGVFGRLAGLIVAFDLLMAILLARRADIFTLNRAHGSSIEVELFYIVAGLAIFLLGSGRFAVRKGAWD